jgi:hypothetical protein
MMHDQEGRALTARVVKAVDRFTWDKGEGAGSSGVSLVADAQHHLTFENVEELVAPAVIVRSRPHGPRRHSSHHNSFHHVPPHPDMPMTDSWGRPFLTYEASVMSNPGK